MPKYLTSILCFDLPSIYRIAMQLVLLRILSPKSQHLCDTIDVFINSGVDVEGPECRNYGNASVERWVGVIGSDIYDNMNSR